LSFGLTEEALISVYFCTNGFFFSGLYGISATGYIVIAFYSILVCFSTLTTLSTLSALSAFSTGANTTGGLLSCGLIEAKAIVYLAGNTVILVDLSILTGF